MFDNRLQHNGYLNRSWFKSTLRLAMWWNLWDGLHIFPADLLPRRQKCPCNSAQMHLTSQTRWQLPPCNPPFGIMTVLILSAMVASWHPTGATLVEGRSGTLSCNPVLMGEGRHKEIGEQGMKPSGVESVLLTRLAANRQQWRSLVPALCETPHKRGLSNSWTWNTVNLC